MTSTSPALHPWWKGAVIYQVYPRSYADSNNDGIGDLPGITAKLDYIASLGVDAIWLSPFFTSPMRDFGYDVADYCDVDPIFGTLADFDALIREAHTRGIRIIIDQVYSHTSDQHPWFVESRESRGNAKADWYIWADAKPDGSPPSNWQAVFGGPCWTWDARRQQYYMHNFLSEQPDLNVHNPHVQDAIVETTRFWLDRGVDGFRLDALNFIMHDPIFRDNPPATHDRPRTRPFDFQQHIHNQSHDDIPAFLERLQAAISAHGSHFTVAEIGGDNADAEMRDYTRGPDRLNSAYGFTYLYAPELSRDVVHNALAEWPGEDANEGWPSWAFSNHDAPRAVTRWATGRNETAFAKLTLTLLACLRGNIFLYQGEELGLPQAHVPYDRLQDPEAIANWPLTLGRDGARTPMVWTSQAPWGGFADVEPWLPVDPAHLPLAVAQQEGDQASVLHWSRAMVAMRRASPALRTGSLTVLDTPDGIVAFERTEGSSRMLCVFNLSHAAIDWVPDHAGHWRLREAFGGGVLPATLDICGCYVAAPA